MFKKIGVLAVLLVAVFFVAGIVLAAEEGTKTQTTTETKVTTVNTEVTPAAKTPEIVGNKVCPVSGMKIEELGKNTVEYKGKVYNLCSPGCKDEFLKDPDKYVAKVDKELAEEKAETKTTEAKEMMEQKSMPEKK